MTTTTDFTRRALLTAGVAGLALSVFGRWTPAGASEGAFEVTLSEAEWRAKLTDQQYAVLREEATERAFNSPLNDEKRKGMFHCAGCDLPAYSSETKYDSGTGWPSFWKAEDGAIVEREVPFELKDLGRMRLARPAKSTSQKTLLMFTWHRTILFTVHN